MLRPILILSINLVIRGKQRGMMKMQQVHYALRHVRKRHGPME